MTLKYQNIFDRMLKAGGIRNSSELARLLNVTPQALSNYKKRGELPASLVFRFAEQKGVSMDWLITGDGISRMRSRTAPTEKIIAVTMAEVCREAGAPVPGDGENPALSGDEIECIVKLLTVMRGRNAASVPALKAAVDAFYLVVTGPPGE